MKSKIKIVEQEQGLEASDCVYKHVVGNLKGDLSTTIYPLKTNEILLNIN
jgi:hypothetical protein